MKKAGIIFLILLLLLLAATALLALHFFPDMLSGAVPASKLEPEPEPKPVVAYVVKEGQSSYRIYADAKDLPAVAAAEYLSLLFLNRLGIEIPVDTVRGEGGPHIIFRAERGKDDGLPFVISLEEDGDINISLRAGEQNYGCARALMERWLSPECGLEGNTLLLNQELIDTAFTGLSFELEGTLRILSQNICASDEQGENSIAERALRFNKLIERYTPDVIGMQEVSEDWRAILQSDYSEKYEIIGCSTFGKESTLMYGNYILFRKDRFILLNGDTFWLSETPGIERSTVEIDCGPRTCAWALLKDQETGRCFYVGTTHPTAGGDADSMRIRSKQVFWLIAYVEQLVEKYGEYPIFLAGDFNMIPAGDPDLFLYLSEKYTNAATAALYNGSEIDYTFQNFGKSDGVLLDYCFFKGENVVILAQRIANDMFDGYVSDHYGLLTDVYLF